MTEKEKYDYFCENYEELNDENRDKLMAVGEKLLEIKKLVLDSCILNNFSYESLL